VSAKRIVSFLPAATEMVCALGLSDRLVGITEECDYPAAIAGKPVVVRCALRMEGLSLSEIDTAVSRRISDGASLYEIDESLLQHLEPDLILTLHLCQVCAPSGNEVSELLKSLKKKPEILWMTPQSVADIEQNIRALGEAAGVLANAEKLIASGRNRLKKLNQTLQGSSRPRVFFMEWIDPVFCAGHWVPEMIEMASGIDLLGRKGADSVRLPWDEVVNSEPEILIVAPCGFNLEKALRIVPPLLDRPGLKNTKIYAVDANAYFARPGPRIFEGVELLAHLFHPEIVPWKGPQNAFRKLST